MTSLKARGLWAFDTDFPNDEEDLLGMGGRVQCTVCIGMVWMVCSACIHTYI